MGIFALTNCGIWLAGTDITAAADNVDFDTPYAELDVTTFGSGGSRSRIAGLEDASAKIGSFCDTASVEPQLASVRGVGNTLLTATSTPTGGVPALGDKAFMMRGLVKSYKFPYKIGEAWRLEVEMPESAPEAIVNGAVIYPKTSISSTTNGTGLRIGAQSAVQLSYFGVHVFAVSGDRTVTAVLQSAAANTFASPTARVSLGAISAVGSGYGQSNVTTTDTWWRVVLTIGGTTGSVSLAAFAGIN